MINQERLVEEFIELVKVDSRSGQERRMADALKEKLNELGLDTVEDKAGEKTGGNAGNLIATLRGNQSGVPTVLFAAHMDRVTPGDGIKPRVDDGVIRSDGSTILASDDVAGIVQIFEAIRTLQEQEIPHGKVEVLFTIGEESGLFGAKNVDRHRITASCAFFLDGGGDVGTIIPQAPAQSNISVTITGKAAHAGLAPENGINAISVGAHAISHMTSGRIDAETTANIGVINGGQATNIVCDRVEIRGEARSRDQGKLERQIRHMASTFQDAADEYGAQADIHIEQSYPAMNLQLGDPVVDLAVKAVESMGIKANVVPTGGGSDANILVGQGLPSVILSIGMENVHSTQEYIKIDQLVKGAELVIAIIRAASSST